MNELNNILSQSGIQAGHSIEELLDRFHLNWTVEKRPLFLPGNIETEFFGVTRTDNNKVFACVKDSYEPYQNSELVQLVNEAANNVGLDVTNGGYFKGGALTFLQLNSGSISGLGENNDTVKKFITALNSHDGSVSLKWALSNITISCMNTFNYAAKELSFKAKHTTSMREKIYDIIHQIEKAQEAETKLYDIFFKFAEVPIGKKEIEKTVKLMLDINLSDDKKDISTYKYNRLSDLSASINKETKEKGNTLWGLFSGVTHYTTHKINKQEANRFQSKNIGTGYNLDNKVFESFKELLEVESN